MFVCIWNFYIQGQGKTIDKITNKAIHILFFLFNVFLIKGFAFYNVFHLLYRRHSVCFLFSRIINDNIRLMCNLTFTISFCMWEFSSELWLFVFLNFSTLCECMFYLFFFLIWGMCLVYVSVVYKVKHCINLTLQFLWETLVTTDHIIWVQFELSAHIRLTLKIVYLFTLKLIVCNY